MSSLAERVGTLEKGAAELRDWDVDRAWDTFAVSAALGLQRVSASARWRISLLMSGFEMVRPSAGRGSFGRGRAHTRPVTQPLRADPQG